MKKMIKEYNHLLIAFIMTLSSVMIVYVLKSVTPFGKGTLLTIDFYHQYGPMLGELYDRVTGGLNFIYSFRMGLGLPIYRNFFNYLSSPFNIIILLFKHKDLLASYSVIIALKAAASALTMCYYLSKKFNKNYLFVGLSILYALSAYYTAYYWNIMWLDGMVMLPLIVYGIEKIIEDNKCLLYIVSLTIMIIANYYIAYMICIFSVLYFITYLIISTDKKDPKTIKKQVLLFIISSIIAGGLCAFFILPLYEAMKNISATGDTIPTSQYYYFSIKEFIFGHLSGVKTTVLASDVANAPNVSTSVLSIGLLLLFICNKKIDNKIKVGYIFLLSFLILSYVIAPLDFIWHGFHTPNDLPFRYSFIYSFIMIIISAYALDKIKYSRKTMVVATYVILVILIVLAKILGYKCLNDMMFITNYLLVTVYFLLYVLSYLCKNKTKAIKAITIVFIFVISIESILATDNNWKVDTFKSELYKNYDKINQLVNYIESNDHDIYRIEKDACNSYNDPSWYGYNGQVAFSSMQYEEIATQQYDLGMPGNYINSFYYSENTPVYNMMFGIKYILGDITNDKSYTLYHRIKDLTIYENKYNLGLMYGVNKDIKDFKVIENIPLDNQNSFIENSTNISDVLERIYVTSEIVSVNKAQIVKYKFENNKDDIIYAYFPNDDTDLLLMDKKLYYFVDDYDTSYFKHKYHEMASYKEKHIIITKGINEFYIKYQDYRKDYDDEVQLYRINYDKLNKAYDKLNSQKVKITDFKENHIKAQSNFKEDLTMYTSIPYDMGWKAYIDGKEVKTYKLASALLGFDVKKGSHNIELKYEIPHIKEGLCISAMSIGGLVILTRKTKSPQKKKKIKKTK